MTNKPELAISQRRISAFKSNLPVKKKSTQVLEMPHAPEDSMIKMVDLDDYI